MNGLNGSAAAITASIVTPNTYPDAANSSNKTNSVNTSNNDNSIDNINNQIITELITEDHEEYSTGKFL